MRIVVTGAAGFIGANLVKALNRRGVREIVAVDNLARAEKFVNLVDCEIEEFLDKEEFLALLSEGDLDDDIGAVLHEGACSDTMEADGRYMMRNNYRYSVSLLDWCQSNDVPFLYASSAAVYGDSAHFREERACEAPLNVYAYSKLLFDQHVRRLMPERTAQIAGFRYFNVYGPREQHKGRGSSVAWHFCRQYRENGYVSLFESSGGYAAGEQRRDFVAVEDVVNVNLDFLDHPERSGIFNVGTGRAATFNDVAKATVNACRAANGEGPRSLPELVSDGVVRYIPMPSSLAAQYQSYTEADLSRLRAAGYAAPMQTIDEGLPRYIERLISGNRSSA